MSIIGPESAQGAPGGSTVVAEAGLTEPQIGLLRALRRASEAETIRHPDSGGWVEWYWVVTDWGGHIPYALVQLTACRVWSVLERHGLVEDHPDPRMSGLVRPKR